ncbi:arabinofuranosyltransferase [Geodermatophilus sp. TF02-6]|uniref:arabinofuranosyltransferase n=1 Tax=Geodermatophilus sp. TF02-6 TaxID=2250575 RepID=UPI0011BD4CE6|nr:arabinofuranosyltransferase [Geodermatophilus sp. TF02-6]
MTPRPRTGARPAGASAEPVPVTAGGRATRARHLLPWVLVPVLVTVAALLLPAPSNLRSQYQSSAVALLSAPLLAWLLTRRSQLAHHCAGALVAGLLPGLTLIALHGSGWFFSGPYGDQSFRLEYATRFADDLSLADYTYRDVPAFYSPGWFWVVGLVARLTGEPAWHAYKYVAVASLYVAAAIAFLLWRRTCDTRLSAILLATTVIGLPFAGSGWLGDETLLFAGAYEPYGWLIALPLPALLAWFASARGPFSWRRALALGLAVGLAAWLYLLYAVVLAVSVVVVAGWRWRVRGRLGEVAVAGLTSMVLVAPWLGRFLVAWLAAGMPPSAATTWVEEDSYVRLFTPSPSPWALLSLLGAVGVLVVDGEVHRRVRGLQSIAAAVVLLGVVQLLAGQIGGGVLFHRLMLILGITLLAAGTLVVTTAWPHVRARLAGTGTGVGPRRTAAAVLAVALLIGLSGHASEWVIRDENLRRQALDVPHPDGSFPVLASSQARESLAGEPSVDDIATAVRDTARAAGQDPAGMVVLTDAIPLLATTPFHAYQQWWALYANPLGEYSRRRAFLEDLQDASAAETVRLLRGDPEAPTAFVLRPAPGDPDQLGFTSVDWAPTSGLSTRWSIRLPRALFDRDDFVTTEVGPWVVAAIRPA